MSKGEQHTQPPVQSGEFGGAEMRAGSCEVLRMLSAESDLAWYQRVTIMAVHALGKRILPKLEQNYEAIELSHQAHVVEAQS